MREDLLQSAVSFLSSAQVQTAAKEKKVQFLKNKGLNDQEIEEAFKRVGTTTANDDTNQVQVKKKKKRNPF
jgi:SOS response regulatory protein OraA/RecX